MFGDRSRCSGFGVDPGAAGCAIVRFPPAWAGRLAPGDTGTTVVEMGRRPLALVFLGHGLEARA